MSLRKIKNLMLSTLTALSAVTMLASAPALAAGGPAIELDKAPIDLRDNASLQRGAKMFVNYCLGCHQMQYQRYNRVAQDLGIPEDLMLEHLVFTDTKIGEHMTNAMPTEQAAAWFGAPPPDLTLSARLRGADWLYTYLRSFYADASRPFGVNNLVFKDVGMPHVLEELQGTPYKKTVQRLVDGETVVTDLEQLEARGNGELSPEEFDAAVADLVNFMVYSGDPVKLKRHAMAPWIMGFIVIFGIFVYLLKQDYWREIKSSADK